MEAQILRIDFQTELTALGKTIAQTYWIQTLLLGRRVDG